ncbi:DMT family transporter [soil metagenome]
MAAISPTAGAGELKQNVPLGIALMLLGFLMFSANDALGKWLAETYSPFQILMVRSIAAGAILSPFILRAGIASMFALEQRGLHVLRIFFATAEVFCFYSAVSGLPLADCLTYYLAGPIYVTVLAALVLKERVGWRRWTAVGVGFVGVLIALRPSTGVFTMHSAIALIGSLLYSGFLVTTRTLRSAPDLPMAGWQVVGAFLLGAAGAPFQWAPIAHGQDVLLLGLLGVTALIAILCVNRSLKLAPASVVVPYQYTLIVWAVLFGYFVFGDVPSWRVVLGAAIIVAAGLFIFFREQVVEEEPKVQVASGQ